MSGRDDADRAAVLLAMGGPASPSDVVPFMSELFRDPHILPLPRPARERLARLIVSRRAERARERYRLVGGSSPIHGYTEEQVRRLSAALPGGWVVRHAFRYTAPRAAQVVRELVEQGVRRVAAIPLYPQRSFTTTDSSLEDLRAAASGSGLAIHGVEGFCVDAELVSCWVRAIAAALSRAAAGTQVVMTAHSIPTRNVGRGDPYVSEVVRTARAVARGLPRGVGWRLAYQSRVGPVGWVGPDLSRILEAMGRAGVRSVVVAPISFTAEHLETLLELDMEMREVAGRAGIGEYLRVPVPGLSGDFIRMLARLARRGVSHG
jgi:ferrochelatase